MSLNTAAYAGVRKWDTETLHRAATHLEGLQAHPGWEIFSALIAQQQQAQLEQLMSQVHDQAKYSNLTGIALGLKRAHDAPEAVTAIAKQVLEERQRSAEADEQRGK